MKIPKLPTLVYIDGSNIRFACSRSMGFDLDFLKLHEYLEKKYPKLQEAYYFEGISTSDKRKKQIFAKYNDGGFFHAFRTDPPSFNVLRWRLC